MKSSWMLVASLLFAAMGICVKFASEYFSAIELVFYRSFLGLIFIGGIITLRKGSLATTHFRMHVSRGLTGFVSLALYFYAMTQLPVATAITLNYTSAMFLALITVLWYREKVKLRLVLAVSLGFIGVIFLLKPTINQSQLPIGLLGLISGFFAAVAYLNVKQLSGLNEPDWRVVFYFCLTSTILSALIACFYGFHVITLRGGLLLLLMGTFATLAQLSLTRAYRVGQTLVVSALAYSTIVFTAILGMIFLNEMLSFWSWVGAGIIVAAGLLATQASASTSD